MKSRVHRIESVVPSIRLQNARRFAVAAAASVTLFGMTEGAFSQVFTSGSLIIDRLNVTGQTAVPNADKATPVFLDQFSTTGTSQTVPSLTASVPSTGTGSLVDSGTDTSSDHLGEGFLTTTSNGLLFNIAGYDGDMAFSNGSTSQASAGKVNRVTGYVAADGTFTRSGATSTFINGADAQFGGYSNIYGAVSAARGANVYAGSLQEGIFNFGSDPTNKTGATRVTTLAGSASPFGSSRAVNIFAGAAGGQLYYSSSASSNGTQQGIYTVGNLGDGLPTGTDVASTLVINTRQLVNNGNGSSSPRGFSFNTAMNVAYVADTSSTKGIAKFVKDSNGAWTLAGFATNGAGGAAINGLDLVVDWTNPNAPVLYATNTADTAVIKIVDNGNTATGRDFGTGTVLVTTNSFGSLTTVATARTGTLFQGVGLALQPSAWTTAAADGSTTNWVTATPATQYSNFSLIQAADSNVAFQNVNSGASALNLTVNNNSTIGSVSSINFTPGYGTSATGTAYTLTGAGLTVTGTAATSAIGATTGGYTTVIANNTGVAQTVSLPITLGAANQAFSATTANLRFTSAVATNGNAMSVRGANKTFFTGGITGNGPVTIGDGATANSGTLSGTGTIAAPITVASGGTITAGSADGLISTLTSTAGETWQSGGTFLTETNGTTADRLVLFSLADTAGPASFTINVLTLATLSPLQSIILATDQSTTGNAFAGLNGVATLATLNLMVNGSTVGAAGYVLSTQQDTDLAGGGYDLILTAAVPEPASLAVFIGVAMPLALRRRRAC